MTQDSDPRAERLRERYLDREVVLGNDRQRLSADTQDISERTDNRLIVDGGEREQHVG